MFNLNKKSKASYIIDVNAYKVERQIPSAFFDNIEKYSKAKDFGCPANKSMKNRLYYIPAFADLDIEFGIKDAEEYYKFVYDEKQLPINELVHKLLNEIFFLGIAKNNVLNFQATLPYLFVTDDKELEIMSIVPNVKAVNAEYALGSFYPYGWLRHINSAWISKDTSKPSYITYRKGEPMVFILFNKPVDLKRINMNDKIKEYRDTHIFSTSYTVNAINYFKKVINFRPKKLL